MMQPKTLRLLGLARRAGKLVYGLDSVSGTQSCLIVTASDAGASVLRNAERLSNMRSVIHLPLPYDKQTLGHAVGTQLCSIAALTDRGLSEQLITCRENEK